MPSLKRKDLSDDEEDAVSTFYEPRRSLSPATPAPSPKRRRCDILENGMSQLTLDGRRTASLAPFPTSNVAPPSAPTVYFPDTPSVSSSSQPSSLWADISQGQAPPQITPIPTNATVKVVLPGSVEEPSSSPEASAEDAEVRDVSMKVPSWYEIEKDRTSVSSSTSAVPGSGPSSLSPSPNPSDITITTNTTTTTPVHTTRKPLIRRPPASTVDASSRKTGIVITDLEDSDTEDGETTTTTGTSNGDNAPAYTISSALLDRLPKPHTLGPVPPEPNSSNALVLYRPVVPAGETTPWIGEVEEEEDGLGGAVEDSSRFQVVDDGELQPMGEEVPMEDTRPCTPMALEPTLPVDEPVDEPMDIEML